MRYELYKPKQTSNNLIEQFLYNRDIIDADTYLNLDNSVVNDYSLLDNIDKAVKMFDKHFTKRNCIGIIPDSDVDGQCSSAQIYLYVKRMCADYPIKILYHSKSKSHDLSDIVLDKEIKLLIIADAGTNDTSGCKRCNGLGIDVIVLDHHEKEKENPYAIIVNNQCSKNYPNKQLSGGGIVYRWLQALDDFYWNDFADDYLDLTALANISDVMDLREYETRYFVDKGLANIKNKFISEMIKSQDYSMHGRVNIHNVQWQITPLINALIRMGTAEERELLFKAFTEQDDEVYEHKKRATKEHPSEIIKENVYERVVRLCKNIKGKQDRQREKSFIEIAKEVKQLPKQDKVIMIDSTDLVADGLSGVIAIKVAEAFGKPCILLRKRIAKDGTVNYGGSARNVNHSPIASFKDIVNQTGFIKGAGHANAFGIVELTLANKYKALNKLNELLKDVEYDSVYKVDFILNLEDVNIKLITDLSQTEDLICYGVDEPCVAIENITLTRDEFKIFGKNEDAVSFMKNDIKYIQFKCKEGNPLYNWLQDAWSKRDCITFTIVGKPLINEYNGVKTPQIIIDDVNVINIGNSQDEDW